MTSRITRIILFAFVGMMACVAIGVVAFGEFHFWSNDSDSNGSQISQNKIVVEDDGVQQVIDAGPLYFATMTHMEAAWKDDVVEAAFLRHVESLRFAMDLADEYGAKLTIESEKPFARANVNWGVNIMQEILDRGHGVGTHCDFGFSLPASYTQEEFAAAFRENKSLVNALVGPENNLGCSGGGSALDWVLGASAAGFKYVDGVVGMHYLSMDLANRPSTRWTDAFIRSTGFHDTAPIDLVDRMRVIGLADAKDFEEDEDWNVALLAGGLGALDAMGDEAAGSSCTTTTCSLERNDVDALVAQVKEAAEERDTSHIAKVDVYSHRKTNSGIL